MQLYVGNLDYSATEESLVKLFSTCGEVSSAKIITDRDTGRSKGFGFVEMAAKNEAIAAISKLNEYELNGRKIRVNEAQKKSEGAGGGQNRGGGGGNRRW
jgi:RNA recognition motif-containing protein